MKNGTLHAYVPDEDVRWLQKKDQEKKNGN
jgi:hypothetical protein